jgi:UV DNA damage endonuclease
MSNLELSNLKLGYCCLNMYLRDMGIFCSRTCRLDTIRKNGIEYSYDLVRQNLNDLACILRWNHDNNMYLYRMSSEMFPFASHPDFSETYDIEQFRELLQNIGKLANKYKQRLTFHPGQYNQLTSKNEDVIKKTIVEIDFHAKVMDIMGLDNNSVIVVHGGTKKDGLDKSIDRLIKNYKRLSESSQRRLVLENCEMAFSIEDLLVVCEKMYIPLVIDYHHHNINKGEQKCTLMELSRKVVKIWKDRGIIPLFHISESRPEVKETDNIISRRAHSNYVENLPYELVEILKETEIHLDVEAKMKEQAVLYLYKKYNMYNINEKYFKRMIN